jgi:photosystem II stability/assembly factor-like uncharacterized protein
MSPTLCRPIPVTGDPQFRYLAGGDGIAVWIWPDPADANALRVWVVEDGGRIRYSADHGSNWIYQKTPALAAQKLLDVFFLPDGETGWACGLGGRLLHTLDHGNTWTFANPAATTIFDGFGNPAVLWSARFLDPQFGFLTGKYFLKFTTNGSQSWLPIELYDDASLSPDSRLDPTQRQFEFYLVRVMGDSTKWIGFAGAQWKHTKPGTSLEIETGVLFRGQSDVAGGVKWWKVLEDEVMQEPWDVEFQDPLNGYLVGGHGSLDGKIFHTTDGGTKWFEEGPAASGPFLALYGVAVQGGGKALACGYGGQIWQRDPAIPTRKNWSVHPVPGFTAPLSDAAALLNTDEAWIVGSTGFVRRTKNSGATWESLNKQELQFRGKALHFVNRAEGVIVGQRAPGERHGLVFRTNDGGCTFDSVYPAPSDGDPGIGVLMSVAFASSTEGMAVGTDRGAVFTRSAGLTWTLKNTGLPLGYTFTDVAVRPGVAEPEYWAVGNPAPQDALHQARIFKTSDNGNSWQEVPPPPIAPGTRWASIAFASTSEGFVVGSRAQAPVAFHLVQPDAPLWTDVSPPMAATSPRSLRSVCSGPIESLPRTFAVGDTGVLLRWNGTSFVGVPDIFEFDPSTGAILVNRVHQNFTVATISPGTGRLYVGRDTTPSNALSQESGFVLMFDGHSWKEVKVETNKDLRGLSFVVDHGKVTAFVLGNTSEDNAVLDDGMFSDTVVLLHDVGA